MTCNRCGVEWDIDKDPDLCSCEYMDDDPEQTLTMLGNSEYWSQNYGHQVLDPDGWDRTNFQKSWAELITEDEYLKRYGKSTVTLLPA